MAHEGDDISATVSAKRWDGSHDSVRGRSEEVRHILCAFRRHISMSLGLDQVSQV